MARAKILNKDVVHTTLRFKHLLEAQRIPIQKMIIFGSHAKGRARPDSDIDICIISPKFGRDSISEMQFLSRQSRKVDTRIEPIPVSPKEYRETATPLIWEIKRTGREVRTDSKR